MGFTLEAGLFPTAALSIVFVGVRDYTGTISRLAAQGSLVTTAIANQKLTVG